MRSLDKEIYAEETEDFFLLDTENGIWFWIIGGIAFLILVILITGYING